MRTARRHSGNPEAAVVCDGPAGPHCLFSSQFFKSVIQRERKKKFKKGKTSPEIIK